MSTNLPAILDDFDLETELEVIKAQIPNLSNGLWTDTSNADPGIVALRLALGKVREWLYRGSVRYLPDDLVLQLARLLGLERNPAQKARTVIQLIVGVNSVVQAGYQIADEETGEIVVTRNQVSSVGGGILTVEAEAVTAGPGANTDKLGQYTGIRSAPTSGQVLAASNITPVEGGRPQETLEEFKDRFAGAIKNTNLKKVDEFEAMALQNPSVARARAYRATMPLSGLFVREAGRLTLVCLGPNGTAPVQSVLNDVRDAIFEMSDFNLEDTDPEDAGLYVLGVRIRLVNVSVTVIAKPQYDLDTTKANAEAAIDAYLQPIGGGQNGEGFAIGGHTDRVPSEVIWALEGSEGLDYVLRDSLVISNAENLALDEVIAAGTVTVTAKYGN